MRLLLRKEMQHPFTQGGGIDASLFLRKETGQVTSEITGARIATCGLSTHRFV